MHLYSLIIEVTRKCNLCCEHCLRGEAQNKVFNPEWLDTFIKNNNITHVSTITFTGGEPSLHPEIMFALFVFELAGILYLWLFG